MEEEAEEDALKKKKYVKTHKEKQHDARMTQVQAAKKRQQVCVCGGGVYVCVYVCVCVRQDSRGDVARCAYDSRLGC